MIADSLVVSVDECRRLLGLSRTATYQALRCGQIFSVRIGSRWLIPRAALVEMLTPNQRRRMSLEEAEKEEVGHGHPGFEN